MTKIIEEKDGSLTVNVNKYLTDESFDRTASHMAGEYVSYPAKTLTDEEIVNIGYHYGELGLNLEMIRAILRKAQEK
jgi:hypothetical protein